MNSCSAELIDETDIIFIEKTHIIDFVLQECNAFKAYAKSKAAVFFRIEPAHFKDMRMYHAAAKDLNPSGAFAEAASFASAFEAGNVHFGRRFRRWEMMRTELCLCIRTEELFCENIKSTLQVCHGDVLVDYKTDHTRDSAELVKRYKIQLDLYKRALEASTGKKVKDIYIYSFALGKEVAL